ncbi:hypothetical protein [Nocardia aurantia]|uniref:Uncharacterized protein n=1 Tax=Nocardia aurantia TaxID=2585199 RepID=A0A7K0DQD2_9NOCA|nr:hypothetical protein [Nocardia aurantia]MQY27798.1 hypothetical protein [Nocardia aurantia]
MTRSDSVSPARPADLPDPVPTRPHRHRHAIPGSERELPPATGADVTVLDAGGTR